MPRNMSSTDTIAVGDGGQSLDVLAEQPGEDLGLGLAQLGELLGHVGDRAVVLAELGALPGLSRGGGVPIRCERLGQRLHLVALGSGVDQLPVPLLHLGDPAPGELRDRLLTAGFGDEPHRGGRQVVVRLVERVPAGVGQHEDLRGATAATRAVDTLLAGFDQALVEQMVEVPADCRRGQLQALGEHRGAGRTVSQDRAGDPVPGGLVPHDTGNSTGAGGRWATRRRIGRRSFHNISVA